MSQFPWSDFNSAATLTATPLNSLASGSSVLLATVINNTGTARWDEIEVEVVLGSAAFTGTIMEGALIPSLDGTNFITAAAGANFVVGSDSTPMATCYIDSGTGAKRGILQFTGLRPYQYRFMFRNGLGPPLAATGNTTTWRGIVRETR